jgi:hypothetical protein
MRSEVLKNEQVDKVKLVKTAYVKSIIGSFVVVLVGLITSTIINQYFPLTPMKSTYCKPLASFLDLQHCLVCKGGTFKHGAERHQLRC